MNESQTTPLISRLLLGCLGIVVVLCLGVPYLCQGHEDTETSVRIAPSTPEAVVLDSTMTPTTTLPTASSNILKVPELGIKFTLGSDILDTYYVIDTLSQPGFADFSSRSLVNSGGTSCEAAGKYVAPIGSIIVTTALQPTDLGEGDPGFYGEPLKQVGGKNLYYRSVQGVCSADTSATVLQISQISALKQALQSAEPL